MDRLRGFALGSGQHERTAPLHRHTGANLGQDEPDAACIQPHRRRNGSRHAGDRVRQRRDAKPGMKLGRQRRASHLVPRLEDEDAPPRAGQHERGDERVVAGADGDDRSIRWRCHSKETGDRRQETGGPTSRAFGNFGNQAHFHTLPTKFRRPFLPVAHWTQKCSAVGIEKTGDFIKLLEKRL